MLCSYAFILVIIVCYGNKVLPYLLLFLNTHISWSVIYIIVSINFVVCLFVFSTFNVSKCCCGL